MTIPLDDFDLALLAHCFDLFISYVKVINSTVVVTQGLEQLTTSSVVRPLHAFSCLSVMDPTSGVLGDSIGVTARSPRLERISKICHFPTLLVQSVAYSTQGGNTSIGGITSHPTTNTSFRPRPRQTFPVRVPDERGGTRLDPQPRASTPAFCLLSRLLSIVSQSSRSTCVGISQAPELQSRIEVHSRLTDVDASDPEPAHRLVKFWD